MKPSSGIWIDSKRRILTAEYWDGLKSLGIRTAAIMLDTSYFGWDPQYSIADWEQICRLAIDRDIEVVATTWPVPFANIMLQMKQDMLVYLSVGPIAWEADLEHLWRLRWLNKRMDFPNMMEAGNRLYDDMRETCLRYDCRVEITSHPGHPEGGPNAVVTPRCDRYNAMLYSSYHDWKGRIVPWGTQYAPGRRQRAGLARTLMIPGVAKGDIKVGFAQALWDQQWPGHTVDEAMDLAYYTCIDYAQQHGILYIENRGWSSKWVSGPLSESDKQQDVINWIRNNW